MPSPNSVQLGLTLSNIGYMSAGGMSGEPAAEVQPLGRGVQVRPPTRQRGGAERARDRLLRQY